MPTTPLRPARSLLATIALVAGLMGFSPAAHAVGPSGNITGNVATWGDRDPANDHDGDGSLGFGDNYYGQQDIPAELAGTEITAVAASARNSMALDGQGKVHVWGDPGSPDNGWATAPPAGLAGETVVAIDTGTGTMMALTDDGIVHTWGSLANVGGSLAVPAALAGKKVTAINAAGADLALTGENGGKVYGWGPNYFGEANVPTAAQSGVVAIAGDRVTSLALKSDGSIVMWGSPYGTVPTADPGRHFVDIAAGGDNHYAALDDAGKVYTWGYFTSPPPESLVGKHVVSLSVGQSLLAAVTDQGEIVVWGSDGYDYDHGAGCPSPACVAADNSAYLPANVATRRAVQVAVGASHLVAALQTPVVNVSAPTIGGTPRVGETLTATTGTWSPADADVSLQWRRDGVAINGATGTGYTLTEADDTATITVSAVAGSSGHLDSAEITSAGVVVAAGAFTSSGAATVTGRATVGSTLTATSPTWAPSPAMRTHQWLRNGLPISGATAPSYVLGSADLGKRISVTITATRAHYVATSATSAASAPVVAGAITASRPVIKGTAKVGRRLTVVRGGTTPSGTTITYQWLRKGRAIKGATRATYKVTTKDRGKALSVRVIRAKAGYATLSLVSRTVRAKA